MDLFDEQVQRHCEKYKYFSPIKSVQILEEKIRLLSFYFFDNSFQGIEKIKSTSLANYNKVWAQIVERIFRENTFRFIANKNSSLTTQIVDDILDWMNKTHREIERQNYCRE